MGSLVTGLLIISGIAALLDTQSFFERNFVEWIDAHFYAIGFDATAVALDANAHVVINDPLEADQYFIHE